MIQQCVCNRGSHPILRFIAGIAVSIALIGYASAQVQQQGVVAVSQASVPQIHTGFLFIDGRYVPPPYQIELGRKSIHINGEEFAEHDFDLSNYHSDGPSLGKGLAAEVAHMGRAMPHLPTPLGTRKGKRKSPLKDLFNELNDLRFGAVIVLFRKSPPVVLPPTREGHELLQVLCSANSSSQVSGQVPATLQTDSARRSWQQLVAEFEPDDEFVGRASQVVRHREEVFAANAASVRANLWRGKIGFPLTVFAIVIVVLAFGHLLSTAPRSGGAEQNPLPLADARRTIIQSLLFFGLLSSVDLIWTLLAYQAGSMRELNPLGSRLIADPSQLILFKLSITAFAIGLLYWFHQAPLAQRASWWCCLILTLLTARWLTFQSMFL